VSDALYDPLGDGRYQPSDLTRGPWDRDAQHGGAPAALLAGLVEATGPGEEMRVARLTYELVRPVPLTELRAETEVVRPGRRVQLVEARLHAGDALVVRALAVRVRRAPGAAPAVDAGEADAPPPGPENGRPSPLRHADPSLRTFAADGMEIRFLEGAYERPGPATAWFALRAPVLPGQTPSGAQRAAAAADFGNGVSSALDWHRYLFINPDLTVYLEREPAGEWIALDARTRIDPDGSGVAESALYDERGRVGRGLQGLLVEEL
jgi:Thioesterase-like superfamily